MTKKIILNVLILCFTQIVWSKTSFENRISSIKSLKIVQLNRLEFDVKKINPVNDSNVIEYVVIPDSDIVYGIIYGGGWSDFPHLFIAKENYMLLFSGESNISTVAELSKSIIQVEFYNFKNCELLGFYLKNCVVEGLKLTCITSEIKKNNHFYQGSAKFETLQGISINSIDDIFKYENALLSYFDKMKSVGFKYEISRKVSLVETLFCR